MCENLLDDLAGAVILYYIEQFLEIALFNRFVVYSHNPIEYKWFGDLQKLLLLCHGA